MKNGESPKRRAMNAPTIKLRGPGCSSMRLITSWNERKRRNLIKGKYNIVAFSTGKNLFIDGRF
jgi:hypothetical protein